MYITNENEAFTYTLIWMWNPQTFHPKQGIL